MSLIVQDLTKLYGTQKALNQLSFRLEPGEVVGFLGPNGAGKTTTMRILIGYLAQDSGTVELDGLTHERNSLDMRRRIGYLPEHNPLYLDMYLREFLTFAGELQGMRSAPLKKRIAEVVELTGLGSEQHKKIGMLSKGYRQRVGLAQAILHNPDLLILDEPTSGLDPNQVLEIRRLIQTIGQEKTVLFSSHIMSEVEAISRRVILINRGELKADTTLEGLQAEYPGQKLEEIFRTLTGAEAVTAEA